MNPSKAQEPKRLEQQEAFSPSEIERYSRHVGLRGLGGAGQRQLKSARVLVIGAGGLGSPLLLYLAAAGIGTLGIVDPDEVSLSNLQRQIIYGTPDIGVLKTESTASALSRLNPHTSLELYPFRLDSLNAPQLIENYDIIADGTDNFDSRYLISDQCYYHQRTLVTGGVGEFEGSLTTLKPHLCGRDGNPNPTYRCLFPPTAGAYPSGNCSQFGILNVVPGIIGSLMALEILREIVGSFQGKRLPIFPSVSDDKALEGILEEGLVRKLLFCDFKSLRFEMIHYQWDKDNPLNGENTQRRANRL